VSVGVVVSKGLKNNHNNLKPLAREMRLETCGMQTVFNITMLKLKIKQERNIQNNTKRKKRKENRNFCVLHLFTCFVGSLHDPEFSIKTNKDRKSVV
jgi:hypothetical protein